MKKVPRQSSDRTVRLDRFMNEFPLPVALLSVIKPNFSVGIPAGMIDPTPEIKHPARHAECGVDGLAATFPFTDCCRQLCADALIRVDVENPIVCCLIR